MEAASGAKRPEDVWVVIGAYNEETRIGQVLEGLRPAGWNVVVVDDGSRDGTAAVALKWPVVLLQHRINLGAGAALQTGIEYALRQGARYIVSMDAVGQHRVEDVPRLLEALERESAAFALGSRFLGAAMQMPRMRRIILRGGAIFAWVLTGRLISDTNSGFRAMTSEGARRIKIRLNRFEHPTEFIQQVVASGLKYVEVPVTMKYTSETLKKGQKNSAAIGLALRIALERILR